MSRSYKIPIVKDRPRNQKKSSLYWRRIRRVWKHVISGCRDWEQLEIPHQKTIVNDYDICDYTINYQYDNKNRNFWLKGTSTEDNKYVRKAKRK